MTKLISTITPSANLLRTKEPLHLVNVQVLCALFATVLVA